MFPFSSCIVKSMKSGSDCPVCKVPYRRRGMMLAFYFQFESLSFFSYLRYWSKEEGVFCIYFIFFASEVRAAPHMDNLVSIYKSMEIASGFNIFVTQNPPPSTKLSGDAKKKKQNQGKLLVLCTYFVSLFNFKHESLALIMEHLR